ncbi:BQ5605_C002g01213 [Microbotryum silenes-dioicae]|uniref:BQ5605_C002g01213 protein n=1 Tax=Microbotryum silenes-dioicae TaxID=796604 RepID=A0A2X0LY77_9BASI|nr:BQ5605_C002g01213 [Microbotryum silenes-dioicae]
MDVTRSGPTLSAASSGTATRSASPLPAENDTPPKASNRSKQGGRLGDDGVVNEVEKQPSEGRGRTPGTRDHGQQQRKRLSFSPDRRPWPERSTVYQFRPFRGMITDVRKRLPFYLSDWTEAFRPRNWERTMGATIRIYFLNLFPALAYTIDMNLRTGGSYGVNETLLASVLAALVFSVLSVQPLTIVGVTGLINLFNYTTYDILERQPDAPNFLQFQAWALIWSAITHWIIAVFNISDYTRFITDMTSETFGLYVGVIYIQKGVELLVYEFDASDQAGWFSVVVAILFALSVYLLERTATLSFGPFWLRKCVTDYAFAAGIVFYTGFVHIPGHIKETGIDFLQVTRAFHPSTDRSWVIRFWDLPVKWIFVALPFGCLVTLLFYFDNNVSSVMAQSRGFPVKRPAGFHWDFFLLGCVTFVAGILGLPAPNGLVPQAPVHTEALCAVKMVPEDTKLTEGGFYDEEEEEDGAIEKRWEEKAPPKMKVVRIRLVEQRISHFAMGLLTLGTMTGPLLVTLSLMSRAMFAGIFIVVGWGSVQGNGIVHKTLFLLRDHHLTPRDHALLQVRPKTIWLFVGIQWLFFTAIVAISETIAGIGFPVIITLLIPFRYYWVPRWFSLQELSVLDAPTADSAATLVSLGGPLQPEHGHSDFFHKHRDDEEASLSEPMHQDDGTLRKRTTPSASSKDEVMTRL